MANRALNLLCLAAVATRAGKGSEAARLLAEAALDDSLPAAARMVAASNKPKRVTAAAWPFAVTASASRTPTLASVLANVGEELREDVNDQDMREVQEADLEDDFDVMGLGDDLGDDLDTVTAADGDDDEDDEDEDDKEDDKDDKDEKKKEDAKAVLASRVLANLRSAALAAKKKKAARKTAKK